ncbi:MAG: NADPH:quinone oxidoreductase family protein [Okeania sp. SIO2F4]|uniref:quinone oxidoreductase family protein n=1 Tax=Okeania sp. SIO2F4 TaxID=2607790 RepID=UPI00142D03B2|nr:NADPH:quinone oxidoreductase family protein [Okeania sp. SIO2F4]NES06432.1 NADPH:quinone oxidoreductase family protein [Okeania sp. SIO2F4]
MKAVRIHEYTGISGIQVVEKEILVPSSGEVRVFVKAAGINNSDLQMTYGKYKRPDDDALPQILGQEAAGVVDAVGEKVEGFSPGMRVMGHVRGAFAEMAIAPATELLAIPEDISFEVAASLPINYLTAIVALIHRAKVRIGEWVLVHPGSGGVGTAAVQLAKLLGAKVIATAGNAAKVEYLMKLGADYGIDYSSQNVVSEVGQITENLGVQVALDGGGKVTFADCLGAIANNGRIACYGTTTGLDAALPMGKLLGRNIAVYGIALWYNSYYQASWQTLKDLVMPAFGQGKLQSTIEQVVGLEGVSEALTRIEQRSLMGKIVVVP